MAELENIIGSILSSPESLERIMDVVKIFGGEEKEERKGEKIATAPLAIGDVAGGIDPELITKIMGLLNNYNAEDDRRIKLLFAIRPYIKEEDGFHIDRAIRIVKLSHVAKGALESFLKTGRVDSV